MPIPLDKLFDTGGFGRKGSLAWNCEVFRRAYGGGNGPFDRVCQSLQRGLSVLVCLPGSCIPPAADLVKRTIPGDWKEFGRPKDASDDLAKIWLHSTSVFDTILAWFTGSRNERPQVIFYNVDMLGDGRGGVDPDNASKTAVLYLTECVRSGVVLGLSDLNAGELPDSLRRTFDEVVCLYDTSVERFPFLIPQHLGKKLARDGALAEGHAWLFASRLRWTDPIRAVRIMDAITGVQDVRGVLAQIVAATRTSEFARPEEIEGIEADQGGVPRGFERDTVEAIHATIVRPYRDWASYADEDCRRELRKLPPGLILHGPPGTGKTRLAQWIAKSIGLPVRQVSAADLKRADWGLTERLVRDLFRSARRAAPCVIVLDDADDLLPDRESLQGSVASAEHGAVNAVLGELQGFSGAVEGVLVILTTNRFDQVDRAAKSRLSLHYHVPYPISRVQVGEIVDSVARFFGLVLEEPVRKDLVEFFYGPVRYTELQIEKEAERRRMIDNLFSPREISSAMRLILPLRGNRPGPAEVDRMRAYYERLQGERGAPSAR